ncbi:MAG TPA: hypothetical protein VGP25_16960 [Gemmatimonadaceae bacterium]|jgi:hypothetical protein|nr:hypothetical protein [Gemmatimonadaceae bacterium]
MIPEVVVFSQVALITVGLVASLSAITVALVRGLQPKRTNQLASSSESQSTQLEQLQQSVDAIALEVERIAEAQRFSAKLLAERASERSEA